MGKNVRIASIAVIIVAAAILAYGFVDTQSYRAGYVSGYSMMTRVLDVACTKGQVFDAELCEKTELALYGDESEGDGVYAAQAVDAILGTPAVRTSRWKSRKTSVQAAVPVATAPEPVPKPAPVVEAPKPPSLAQIAQSVNCSAITTLEECGKGPLEPFCKWGRYNAYGTALTTAQCNQTMYTIKFGGDTEGVCGKSEVKDILPGAFKYTGIDPNNKNEISVCISNDRRFGYITPQGGILGGIGMSAGEMLRVPALRTKAQELGATAAALQMAAPSMPQYPPINGGQMPPQGGQPPPH